MLKLARNLGKKICSTSRCILQLQNNLNVGTNRTTQFQILGLKTKSSKLYDLIWFWFVITSP